MKKIVLTLILCLVSGTVLAGPANGNGNKVIWDFEDLGIPIFCDDVDNEPDLWLDFIGWAQLRLFRGAGNPNVELDVYHLNSIYSNASGDTWVWRDRGPDRYYYVTNDEGVPELHWAITGRSALNVIGHAVLNLDTGEFRVVAGQHPFGGDDDDFMDYLPDILACEILY